MVRVRAVRPVRVGVPGVRVRAPVIIRDPDAGEVWVWRATGLHFTVWHMPGRRYHITCSASAFCALFDADGGPTLPCRADSPTELQRLAYAKHRELAAKKGTP